MTITPRGESFLPNFSIDELKNLYQKEVDPIAKIRLLAAILRKEGKTLEEISLMIKHPLTTVGDWLRRLHTEGISRKNNKKQPGRPKRLTDKQIEDLKPILFNSPQEQGFPFIIWTTKLVIQLIEKLYNVSYKPLQVRRILDCAPSSGQLVKVVYLNITSSQNRLAIYNRSMNEDVLNYKPLQ